MKYIYYYNFINSNIISCFLKISSLLKERKISGRLMLLLVLPVVCFNCTDRNAEAAQSQKNIQRINISKREHGYKNFKTTVIKTQNSLNQFIKIVEIQNYWNDKKTFLSKLKEKKFDFSIYNIIFYRHTEGAGGIKVSLEEIVSNKIITININRVFPEIGTADMAYYCFAYLINKKYKKITFGSEEISLK